MGGEMALLDWVWLLFSAGMFSVVGAVCAFARIVVVGGPIILLIMYVNDRLTRPRGVTRYKEPHEQ